MKVVRRILFWLHLATGASCAAVILVMSVTGALLTYSRQVTLWSEQRAFAIEPPSPDAQRLPLDELVRVAAPGGGPPAINVTIRANRTSPAEVNLGVHGVRFVDPYSGRVLADDSGARRFFRVVTEWHRYLGFPAGEFRATGRAITGAANLGFLALVLSGLCLWWPARLRWSNLRPVIWFRRGLAHKARDFNWHNVIGFWLAIPLVAVVLGSAMISYAWTGNVVIWLAGSPPPPPTPTPATPARPDAGPLPPLEALARSAMAVAPGWKVLTLVVPTPGAAAVVAVLDLADSGRPQDRVRLRVETATARVIYTETFEGLNRHQRIRTFFRYAHTGEFFGITGQTVAGVVSAAGAVMVWTGLALAWRRNVAWRQRRAAPRRP